MNDSTCSRCSKHLYRDDFGFLCPDCASADAARDSARNRWKLMPDPEDALELDLAPVPDFD